VSAYFLNAGMLSGYKAMQSRQTEVAPFSEYPENSSYTSLGHFTANGRSVRFGRHDHYVLSRHGACPLTRKWVCTFLLITV